MRPKNLEHFQVSGVHDHRMSTPMDDLFCNKEVNIKDRVALVRSHVKDKRMRVANTYLLMMLKPGLVSFGFARGLISEC
jgi:hypothetical protein